MKVNCKIIKNFFASGIFLVLPMLFSCTNLFNSGIEERAEVSHKSASIKFCGTINQGAAVPLEVAEAFNQAKTDNAKSAVSVMNTDDFYYFVEASSDKGGSLTYGKDDVAKFTTSGSVLAFELPLSLGNWNITVGIKSESNDKICMSDSCKKTLTAEETAISHTFFLHPAQKGNGKLNLKMTVPSSGDCIVDSVKAVCDDERWTSAVTASSITVSGGTATLSVESIPSGVYEVTFNFYKKSGSDEILLYTITQSVNVIDNMTTSFWKDGSSDSPIKTDGSFVLTEAQIKQKQRTILYVGDSSFADGSDTTGTGSAYAPFASFSKVCDYIKQNKNASADYKIFVSGTVIGNQSFLSVLNDYANSITIEGCSGFDENGIPKDSLKGNSNTEPVLYVNSSVPVTIKKLLITGGNNETNGGGIYNSGTLTLSSGCVVAGNTAANGGGVYNAGTMFMYGSAVIGDKSKTTAATKDESCYSNKATVKGGGICSTGDLYLGFSSADKEATLTGGVYYNYAKNSGGIHQQDTSLSNKVFKFSSGSVSYNAERGMYVGYGKFTMTGGTVSGNTALQSKEENEDSYRGGGIYVGADCTAVISGGKITSNEAAVKGGGIHIAQGNSIVTIEGGIISGNTAGDYGSGISMDNGTLKMQGKAKVDTNNDVYLPSGKYITLTGALTSSAPVAKINFADAAWKRGTIVVKADETNVTDLTAYENHFELTDSDWNLKLFSDKKSLKLDAPIYVSKNGHYVTSGENKTTGTKTDPFDTIANACTLLNDKDTDFTICIDGELTGAQSIPATLKKDGSGTNNAKSLLLCGANGLDENGVPKDSLNGGFKNNSNGTTLKILSNVPVTINNLKITGGYAAQSSAGGGGIYNKGDLTLSQGALVSGNYTLSCGGGIYNDSKTLTIESGAEISGNGETSPVNEVGGGAIFNYGGTVMISGGVIKSNSADHDGGAIYNEDGTVMISGGVIKSNYAKNDGGAIYNEDGTVYIYGDTLIGKEVSSAPTSYSSASNYAKNGGAICVNGGTVYLGYKNNNGTAQKDDSANVRIMGNAVKTSDSKGGAIYVEAGTLQIAKTCIGFNYSPYSGAGIYTKGSVRLLEDAVVKGNNAFNQGGGVYVDQGGQLSMTSNSIIGGSESCDANTAASGGGVYVSSNSTDETKKAIVTFCATVATVSPSISGNSATQAGGGVYIDNFGATFNMHSGTISNNKVVTGTTGGGGIEISYGTFNMDGGTISGNKIETPGTSVLGGAVDVNVGGKFNIKGNVSIPYGGEKYNNDVNLRGDPIKITGAITLPEGETFVAAIIPKSYATSTQVFEIVENPNPMTTLSRVKNKFSLIQKDGESWFINNQGYLQVGTLVQSATDLMNNFANINTMTSEQTADLYIVFDRDIDISSETNWMPIGYASKSAESAGTNLVEFKGTIDGNGHTLTISDNQSKRFSALCYTNNGVIQNIKIKSTKTIAFGTNAPHFIFSGICVNNNGIIKNCWNEIDCEGITFEGCGGICITNNGVIENCINTGSITSTFHTNGWGGIYQPAGGIVGTLTGNGVIKNCVNYGTVKVPKKFDDPSGLSGLAGAIAGYSQTDGNIIQNCYWRYNCVRSNETQSSEGKFNTSATDDLNWMICKSQNYDTTKIRKGTFTGNGSFAANNNGTLTAASANDAVTAQTLQYGTNLLSALNSFVSENSSDELCTWVAGNSYAAIPSCFEE